MKKISDFAKELGFNISENTGAQEAFIKHLLKQSHGVVILTPTEIKEIENSKDKVVCFPKQLSFDFFEDQTKSVKNKREA